MDWASYGVGEEYCGLGKLWGGRGILWTGQVMGWARNIVDWASYGVGEEYCELELETAWGIIMDVDCFHVYM